jgi:hypothetical protein
MGPFVVMNFFEFDSLECSEPSLDGKYIFFGGSKAGFPFVARYTYATDSWASGSFGTEESEVRAIKAVSRSLYAASVSADPLPVPFLSADGLLWTAGSILQPGKADSNTRNVSLATNRCGTFMQTSRRTVNGRKASVFVTRDAGMTYRAAAVSDANFRESGEVAAHFAGGDIYVILYNDANTAEAARIAISRDGGVTFAPTDFLAYGDFNDPSASMRIG